MMTQDSLEYDSTKVSRPLPQWLIRQKEGLNIRKPGAITMKEDNSIYYSFAITGIFVLLLIAVLTLFILRKNRRKSQ
jgi:heme/copper-type cytochrome/quinol oxidase subunit 2